MVSLTDFGILAGRSLCRSAAIRDIEVSAGAPTALTLGAGSYPSSREPVWRVPHTGMRKVVQRNARNGVVTTRSFDSITGWLGGSQSGLSGGAALQNDGYLYDKLGNVTQRQNNNAGLSENFSYDPVYRLKNSTLIANGVTTTNLNVTYDPSGNITSRSDVAGGATWTYDPTKIHAVTQAGSAAYWYSYDSDGNAQARNGYSITWTSFEKPTTITSAGESVSFACDPNYERYKAVYSGAAGAETTYFVGPLRSVALQGEAAAHPGQLFTCCAIHRK
jgi:hypothetical protein